MSAVAALGFAAALAGCGSTTYFAGRPLPPSGLLNRVLIAIQNPGSLSSGTLQFVDAFYDIRFRYNSTSTLPAFSIGGYNGSLPATIQNMPEELIGAVYNSGSGTLTLVNYSSERSSGNISGVSNSTSVFITRNQSYVFATSLNSDVLTVIDRSTTNAGTYTLSAPTKLTQVSVNPGGSVALAFTQNSNYAYYARKLTTAQSISYSAGPSSWPKAAVDCEPQNAPGWCLFQVQSPDNVDATGNYYGAPLNFDRPAKAVFSADGSTAYVLNCGPECGGNTASVTTVPVSPLIFLAGQMSGKLPTQATLNSDTLDLPGGASNALADSSHLYVVGQELMPDGFFGGHLTVVTLPSGSATSMTAGAPISISDGEPGGPSKMVLADDDTLWIGMIHCTNGERAKNGQPYGCLTMYNTSTGAAILIPYNGDATGIAAVTGLHKIYTAEGGQVYIYATGGGSYAAGTSIDNENVTVTGTAYDVAYMDATSDYDNTDY
ncbi:MAG: hypothetical protein ACP5FH_06185 [Terracidiphilus sp.]